MNKGRRKEIDETLASLETVREKLDTIGETIDRLRDEEQEYYDTMTENFQNSQKGETAQTAIDALTNAYDEVSGIDLEIIGSYLEEAKG